MNCIELDSGATSTLADARVSAVSGAESSTLAGAWAFAMN